MRIPSMLSFLLATMLATNLALAGENADPVTQKSDALFEQGTKAYQAEKLADAEGFFRRAWALKKTHDTAANLGLVLMKLGRPAEAAGFLDYALHNSPPTDSDRAREAVRKKLDEAKTKALAVHVIVNAEGAELTVDDKPAGAVPPWGVVYLDPGKHTIVARASGYQASTQQANGTAGGAIDVRFDLAPASTGGASPAILIGGGVLAAAGIGAGVVFTVMSSGAASDRKTELAMLGGTSPCGTGTPYVDKCADIRDKSANEGTFRALGIAGFAVGGAALVATVVYGVVKRAKPATTTGIMVLPLASPTERGLAVKGAF